MCRQAKDIQNSFTGTSNRPTTKGKQWYVVVNGPFNISTLVEENNYVFGIIEGKSRFLVQYYMNE